jgi:hypothetical protein
MVQMLNVGEKTARLMMAKPGSFFVFGKNEDVPIRTCKKFGISLLVMPVKDRPFKIVKRV